MEGAMAATVRAPGECSCLQFRRKTELMCSTSTGRKVDVCGSSFSDRGHLQYYRGLAYCSKKNKSQQPKSKPAGGGGDFLSAKKKITLLDGLCKDLSALSNSLAQSKGAAPMDGDGASLADQVRGRILSDALEVIMRQLAQLKAERKERKRQLKAQKKALKARKDESSSSSSSSESSDSECEVVDVSELRRSSQQEKPKTENYAQFDSHPSLRIPAILGKISPEGVRGEEGPHLEFGRTADRLGVSSAVAEQASGDKIEVCMGSKCKKMGSGQLLAAFEGCGVEAVGCKCMGKCRSAPNVRVHKIHSHGDDASSQMHLGVGTEDVDLIISHHFGERKGIQEGDALVSA